MQIISYQIKYYTRDHGSIGLFGNVVLVGNLALSCLGLFLFCFYLVRGDKVVSAQDFGWRSKGEDHFKPWFPFFSCLLVTILYCSDIFWSKDLSVYFFCFLPIFDRKFFFLLFFAFFQSLIRNFLLFLFFRSLIRNFFFFLFFFLFFFFSSEGKDGHSHPGSMFMVSWYFWLRACRTTGHDICQGVGLVSSPGVKGCPTLFP